ncbi:hypothetical protein EST38_g9072 [Candolleomyces aberdarensis]|uniref:Conserved Oligomeric Golgi complex subunit 6 C-terminal domain-containing protein n=1 Tax=Candolleomyces aberdarensis TaxID=2316362 RepID=A0A4Q2DB10_9AGAR|nr:hypothetical protein EST38_g9072 [Candolleomyces aberdarensis]
MTSASTYFEQGYDKILRYLSNEFRSTGKDDPLFLQLEVSPVTTEAVLRLKKRQELLTSFLTALTRGGPSGLPRLIELHAYDPLRYVGDMLAWVHQAIAAEREFGVKGYWRMVGSATSFAPRKGGEETREGEEVEEWIQEPMDLAVVKLCVPTKDPDDPSITPPLFILDHAQVLREVMNVYRSSVLVDDEIAAQKNGDDSAGDKSSDHDGGTPPFHKILDLAVDPIIESAIMKSEEKKKLSPRWDARV